ncbi:hypothetical protein [Rhizobium sp. SSA_523]|uniref:hypothetical protein n=1 Tax=Rhizobium sp. SSA_523 TaxID=2952477 RepID=UPI002090C062|nr:hypothetical protein [Rhizobium sp. SSA_523]MCO5733046.1 hypothetical protein [Rhizobium sp. SSA_523]WKC23926.1 hypothetical protein QTJ18_24675 [Rhizobium sp. SSA_523]
MVKLILTGLWVCVVTLGAVYFSVQMSLPEPPVDEATLMKEKSELVKGETINIPMLSDGAVQGYFLTRISFMMDKQKIKGVHLPVTELMTDELFTLLVGNRMVNLSDTKAFDLNGFRDMLKQTLNKDLGDDYVLEVLVEQLDYMSKDDIRANGDRSPSKQVAPIKIVEGAKVEAPASTGH